MMYLKVVLTSALVAAVSGQFTTGGTPFGFGFQNPIDSLGASAKAGIGLFNTTGQTVVKVSNDGVQGFSGAAKQALNTASSMKSTALNGGVTGFQQGVDIATNLAGIMPGMGGVAKIGGDIAKTGASFVNMAGQTGISVGNAIGTGKLQLVSGLSNAGAGLASSGISKGASMATSGVDTGLRFANSAFGTVGNLMNNAQNYSNLVSGRLSSKANAIANNMAVSSPSLPSTLSFSGMMDKIPVFGAMNGMAISNTANPTQGDTKVQVQVAA